MPWVIGNAKRLRPLSRINLERLPVYYRANPKAWMNSSLFEEVLCHMDSYFRAQNKKILLLVDNAPSHFDPHYRFPGKFYTSCLRNNLFIPYRSIVVCVEPIVSN